MQPHPVLPHHYRTAEEKPEFLRGLFDAGAPFYDRVVGWGSFGTGLPYRRTAERRAGLKAGMRLLDAAAGTGLMAEAAIQLGVRPEDIVCLDPSAGMLEVTRAKLKVETVVAPADAIPLESGQFDFITMGYALRHVASLQGAFSEYLRVLRPGGSVLILEITKPAHPLANAVFRAWFGSVYPALTGLFTRSREARAMMRYYWETMDTVVPPATILAALQEVGFTEVKRHVVGGLFSEYTARKAV